MGTRYPLAALIGLLAMPAAAEDLAARVIRYPDLPAGIARRFDATTFDARIQAIERDTARREREGELDHLVYYALQSRRFTRLPPIEPALSAKELAGSGAVPAAVKARFADFLRALARPGGDDRLAYFARFLQPDQRSGEFLEREYGRAMRFLYEKEFEHRAGVYQSRGHSTDSQIQANYAVWSGLSVLRQLAPELRVRRVLIVGPGLDFAPRTALYDQVRPQSFQPYAVADALLATGLARAGELEIDCADINARVLDFLRRFAAGPRLLELYTEPGDAEYETYFRALGGAAGTVTAHSKLSKTLRVEARVADAVHAARLNILTERQPTTHDLVVATNIFLYYNTDELGLALANIAAMTRAGGYLLHNETRPEADGLAAAAGFAPVQARTLRIATGRKAPLFDVFAIYRKNASPPVSR